MVSNSSGIDWPHWRAMEDVKVFEAAALSLGVDPETLEWDRWEGKYDGGPQFEKRLRLIVNNLGDRDHFTPGLLDLGDPSQHEIKLSELGAWMVAKQIDIPDGFPVQRVEALRRHGVAVLEIDPPVKAVQRQHANEQSVLHALRKLGYDPRKLPKPPAGKASPAKAAARKELTLTDDVFKKAWQRLRDSGEIADA